MDSTDLGMSCYQLIRQNFNLEQEPNQNKNTFDQLYLILLPEVKRLLDVDFNGLLNILYRIDLPETQVTSILELASPNELAGQLTSAIIERYRQKIITRNKYKS